MTANNRLNSLYHECWFYILKKTLFKNGIFIEEVGLIRLTIRVRAIHVKNVIFLKMSPPKN